MTQEQKELFEASISIVHNSPSSIFTEQDVVKVLTDLQRSIDELPESNAPIFTKVNILESVKEVLDNVAYDEFIECEPELHGGYGSSFSLELNTSFDECEFMRMVVSELEDYFTPANKEE